MTATARTRAYLLGLGMICSCVAARAQDVVIVVNTKFGLSRISAEELRDVFTGVRSRLEDGTRAIPVVLRGGPTHEVFLRKHVGDSPQEFRALWRKAVFTGQGAMPREFNSEATLLDYVAATPGAIGYVSRFYEVDGVKALAISP